MAKALPAAQCRPAAAGMVEVGHLRPGQVARLAAAPEVRLVDATARLMHDERLLSGADPMGNARRHCPALAGWANLTGQCKHRKNSLAVGATDALGTVAAASSRGPAHDGRLKPELVAFGDAGLSDAAALVSGAARLVQQA